MALNHEDANAIETLISCEGFERGLRAWHEDIAHIKDKKFKHLLKAFLEAADELEDYLVEQGIDTDAIE